MIDHKSDSVIHFSDEMDYDPQSDIFYDDNNEFHSDYDNDVTFNDAHLYDEPLWDWTAELSPMPGFGFFPIDVKNELDQMTQVGIE